MAAAPRSVPFGSVLLLTALLAATGCGGGEWTTAGSTPDAANSSPRSTALPSTLGPTTPASSTSMESHPVTTVRITFAGQTLTGVLDDNPTARDLASQLPVDVRLSDFNGVEKVGELPRPLTTDDVPAGSDPDVNEIGYYQPSRGIVFYYGDVGYFDGIVRLGRMSAEDMQVIRAQRGTFTVTVDRA